MSKTILRHTVHGTMAVLVLFIGAGLLMAVPNPVSDVLGDEAASAEESVLEEATEQIDPSNALAQEDLVLPDTSEVAVQAAAPSGLMQVVISESGMVAGRAVREQSNTPAAGFPMAIYQNGDLIAEAVTSPDGGFQLSLLPGVYGILIGGRAFTVQVLDAGDVTAPGAPGELVLPVPEDAQPGEPGDPEEPVEMFGGGMVGQPGGGSGSGGGGDSGGMGLGLLGLAGLAGLGQSSDGGGTFLTGTLPTPSVILP